jgi:hypothetical protein
MDRTILLIVCLGITGAIHCKKDEAPPARPSAPRASTDARRAEVAPTRALTGGSESAAPYVTGGGGKRLAAGYETTFTGPKGPVTIKYTQVSGASLGQLGMRLTLDANMGGSVPSVPNIRAAIAPGKEVASIKELVGQTFSKFGLTTPFMIAVSDDLSGFARTASITITGATDDAIEGTFSGEFYDTPMADAKLAFKVTDGTFKAYPAQIVTQQMIDRLKRPPLPR